MEIDKNDQTPEKRKNARDRIESVNIETYALDRDINVDQLVGSQRTRVKHSKVNWSSRMDQAGPSRTVGGQQSDLRLKLAARRRLMNQTSVRKRESTPSMPSDKPKATPSTPIKKQTPLRKRLSNEISFKRPLPKTSPQTRTRIMPTKAGVEPSTESPVSTKTTMLAHTTKTAVEKEKKTFDIRRKLNEIVQEAMSTDPCVTVQYLQQVLRDTNGYIQPEIERVTGTPTIDSRENVSFPNLSQVSSMSNTTNARSQRSETITQPIDQIEDDQPAMSTLSRTTAPQTQTTVAATRTTSVKGPRNQFSLNGALHSKMSTSIDTISQETSYKMQQPATNHSISSSGTKGFAKFATEETQASNVISTTSQVAIQRTTTPTMTNTAQKTGMVSSTAPSTASALVSDATLNRAGLAVQTGVPTMVPPSFPSVIPQQQTANTYNHHKEATEQPPKRRKRSKKYHKKKDYKKRSKTDKKKKHRAKKASALLTLSSSSSSSLSSSSSSSYSEDDTQKDLQPLPDADPCDESPNRNTVRNESILKYFDEIKEQMVLILNQVQNIAITLDGWTNIANVSYLTVTGHFLYKNEFCSILLGIKLVEGATTAQNLKIHVENTLSLYPQLAVVAAVTDDVSNMLTACKDLQLKNLPCFAHTIELVVNTAILRTKNSQTEVGADTTEIFKIGESGEVESAEISLYSILKKVKRIVNYFHSSPKQAEELKAEFKIRRIKFSTLIQSVHTRWNSSYDMLKRFYIARDCINVVLMRTTNGIPLVTPAEIEIIPEILRLLEPFVVVTEQLSGEEYEPVSLIIPFVKQILLELINEKSTLLADPAKILQKHLITLAENKLLPYETRTVPSFATLLDPRFKKHAFYRSQNYDIAANNLRHKLKLGTLIAELPNPSQKASRFSFLSQFRTAVPTTTSTFGTNNYSQLAIEHLNTYLAEPIVEENTNVIQYWNEFEKCDSLKQIALKYMVVPATSVLAEKIYSIAKNLISDQMSRLDAEKIMIIKNNLKLLD